MLHLIWNLKTKAAILLHTCIIPCCWVKSFNRTGTCLFRLIAMQKYNCLWNPFMVPVALSPFHFKVTHSKLVVGVHGSFPHRSGIVKSLHVVGLVEAKLCKKRDKETCRVPSKEIKYKYHFTHLTLWKYVELKQHWLDDLVRDRFVLQTRRDLEDWLHCKTLDVWIRTLRK